MSSRAIDGDLTAEVYTSCRQPHNQQFATNRFCRWGYNHAYHMGDLSAVVLDDHPSEKRTLKYARWRDALFKSGTALRNPIYFWARAWKAGEVGIWREFGPASLTFLEYQMIGVASAVFPADVLNAEGVNRE